MILVRIASANVMSADYFRNQARRDNSLRLSEGSCDHLPGSASVPLAFNA